MKNKFLILSIKSFVVLHLLSILHQIFILKLERTKHFSKVLICNWTMGYFTDYDSGKLYELCSVCAYGRVIAANGRSLHSFKYATSQICYLPSRFHPGFPYNRLFFSKIRRIFFRFLCLFALLFYNIVV